MPAHAPVDLVILQDQRTSGTHGGSAVAGWQVREVNALLVDTGGNCSLSENQFTLQPGTYRVRASSPAYDVYQHQIGLWNLATSGFQSVGTAEYAPPTGGVSRSQIEDRFTIVAATAFEIRHYADVTQTSAGALGVATGIGTEIYTTVYLEKEGS